MVYKHTYQDWSEGKVTWNKVVADYHEDKSCISSSCVIKINADQKKIFKRECKLKLEELKEDFLIRNRDDDDKEESIKLQLKTIDNLFNKKIESLKRTSFINLGEKDEFGNSIEHLVREIPPLKLAKFCSGEIKMMRAARIYSLANGLWNTEVVETPLINNLKYDIAYNGVIYAKAYSDFAKTLNLCKGAFQNSYSSFFTRKELKNLMTNLVTEGFISKETVASQFSKIFNKKFVFKDERVIWLKSNISLKYFITELDVEGLIDDPFDYRKWEVVLNCFVTSSKNDNTAEDNLRKVKFSELQFSDKKKLDLILSSLKN